MNFIHFFLKNIIINACYHDLNDLNDISYILEVFLIFHKLITFYEYLITFDLIKI